ncbi:hypothetical protein BH11PSE3_BH11PSE3_25700 [soil metagenome]
MVDLESLDATIARLDLALARAGLDPRDAIAAHELVFCIQALACRPIPPELDPELEAHFGEAIALARTFEPTRPEDIESLRTKLFDIAAAISVRARD